MRKIFIFTNETKLSKDTAAALSQKLSKRNFRIMDQFSDDVELIICIGGDGAFLQTVHTFGFPKIPIIGINTGHLGFFQELHPDQLDDFATNYEQGKYSIQRLSTVEAVCGSEDGHAVSYYHALNEIVIRGDGAHSVHLNISIGDSQIERFSGDGILVATPAGSTAYNYSLGGSIVDPRLNLLQVTPIAPMNTTAYRSFTSSVLLPADLFLGIVPEPSESKEIQLLVDGYRFARPDLEYINLKISDKEVMLLRFEGYDFWAKVKSKFL